MEQQLIDLQRVHESVVNEKTKIIDKLNSNLAECHGQFQALVACNSSHDAAKMSEDLQQKIKENEALQREVSILKVCIVIVW